VTLLARLKPGVQLLDRRTGHERLVQAVEVYGQVVFLSFKHPQTGTVDRQPFSVVELESRFEILEEEAVAFRADPEIVSLVAEAYRLQHAYLFNHLFATETSLIDLLPHQLAAVYGVPSTPDQPTGEPGMLDMPRLRFLLADDAGAGKTIMAGLLIREMLLRRLVRRVLIVPPAGLVRNWERELRNLFRLRFSIVASSDVSDDRNPFSDPRHDLAIISVDTLWRDRVRAAYVAASPYDLVIFDEAHKLSAWRNADLTIERTRRYEVAEIIARQGRHLLLMTATPHMGKDDPYYFLWRLLEPELLSTPEAFGRLSSTQKRRHLLRRMKEEMVRFDETPIFPPRESNTLSYPLTQGPGHEQDLYNQVTHYCETHYDRARLRNRSAAGLAMSILQRRLASSTWALFKSLERREQKLRQTLQDMELGQLSEGELEARQRRLPARDVRDSKTGDEEEAEDGLEETERQDEEVASATDAHTLAELHSEWEEVRRLVALARHVYDQKHESKFEKLWAALENYPNTKVLIFTEFRDTLEFLVGRLEGKGLTGKIAQIHGGMDYTERESQVVFFGDPHGARILVATDAAGEGINLQFCWLLVNYDIPWNPARLEQRMGRVHRYKQRHDVLLLNLVSKDTREGRVLKVLLDKLENIRRELGSDKVFDIIGQQFTGRPLTELIFEAVIGGKEDQVKGEIERALDKDQVQVRLAAQTHKVEVGQVRALLAALQQQREIAEMQRVMPAYVRRFFQWAAPLVGIGIQGDVEGIFWLDPCPASVQQALATYPENVQRSLTFDRERAMPDLMRDPQAIYLHPGEPVFEAVVDLFLGQHEHQAMRGAIFLDPEATGPYVFNLAKVLILRDSLLQAAQPEIVEEKVTGVHHYADGRCELAPAHLLLTLFPGEQRDKPVFSEKPGLWNLAGDTASVEAFLVAELGQPALETRRREEEERLPQRQEQLRVAYNLWQAELFRQKRLLKDAVEKGVPAARTRLRECEAELEGLDRRRREAETALYGEVDRLRLGPVSLYAQALVLPLPPEEVARRRDAQAEQVALAEVVRREQAEGSVVEDVSAPHLKTGFDLKVLRADGALRYVEVKGRTGTTPVELTANEWAQAANHRDRYWLYVVYHCDSVPALYRVPDPFGRLLARQVGSVRISASDIMQASEEE
jgi:superfamily II DNA or RNA helicase